jgi:hypothetical protein
MRCLICCYWILATMGVDWFFIFIIYFCLFRVWWTTAREFQCVLFFLSFLHQRNNEYSKSRPYYLLLTGSLFFTLTSSCPSTAGPYFNFPGRSSSRTRTLFARQSFHNHWMDFFCAFDYAIWTRKFHRQKSLSRRIDWINQMFFGAHTIGSQSKVPVKQIEKRKQFKEK